MKNINIISSETKEDGTTITNYEIGNSYKMRIVDYIAYKNVYVTENSDMKYLPQILVDTDYYGTKEIMVTMQTTSYGSLKIEEMDNFITAMNEGKEVAETINAFLKIK